MILTSLHAENFRKYTQLHLDDLPERGLLAVIGGNESGKSTVGEAIQFGLFGCTDKLKAEDSHKLIHWGMERAKVTLRLQHRGHEYRLVRCVDQAGNTAATLFSTDEESTLADTPEGVEHQLKALLGYSYGAFSKAFYWGQEKRSNTQDDSDNLRALAGLKEYANISAQLEREQQERQQLLDELRLKRNHTAHTIEALHIDSEQLPRLNNMVLAIQDKQQKLTLLETRLDKAALYYPRNLQRFQDVSRRSRKIGYWTGITLLVFVLALLLGAFLLFNPEWGASLTAGMSDTVRDTSGRWAIRFASLAALLGAALLVYGWYVDMRHLRPLHIQAKQLHKVMQESYAACTQPASRLLDTQTTDYLVSRHVEFPEVSNTHADMASVPEWSKAAATYTAKTLYVHTASDTLKAGLQNRQQELDSYLGILRNDIQEQQQQLEQLARLQNLLQKQDEELEHEGRAQVVSHTAVDLLQRDASYTISRFNQLVKTRCPEFLQRFTQGHYHALEIAPDFSIKVLSEEKGDYLDFSEISTGTQRQVALAMRIALANALADATKTTQQLLFLDEPFAFFDPERTANTLQSLAETSQGKVSQIWLTAQTVPQGVQLAKVIECSQGSTTLKA